jgi:homopolymeric O-antigen transport system permease protein
MKGLLTYFHDIWGRRYFWLSLVRVDLRARYRGSAFGMGWSLLHPIAMTAILCGVFSVMFHQEISYYAPYLMAGLTYWQFITTASIQGCQSFFAAEGYIRQHPVPMAIYPLRTMLGAAFHFLMGYLLVIALSLAFHGWGFIGLPALLSLLPTCALLLPFGWALSALFAIVTVRFRDVKHLSEVAFQALFYLTPIMYTPEQVKGLLERRTVGWIFLLNPFRPMLDLLRSPVVDGVPPAATTYLAAALITLATALVAGVAMRFEERKIIFHL